MASGDLDDLYMLELFHTEVETHAATLTEGLTTLQKDPAASEPLEALARAAHSTKGAARLVDISSAADVAQVMEECFVAAQQGKLALTEDHIDTLLQGVDILRCLSRSPEEECAGGPDRQPAGLDTLISSLKAMQGGDNAAVGGDNAAVGGDNAAVGAAKDGAAGFAADPTMLELFRTEVETHTAALTAGLLELEKDPAATTRLESLMRAAHSIKGAARMVNLDDAVQVAHAIEDCFVAAQKGELVLQPEHIDLLLAGVDALAHISRLEPTAQSNRTDRQGREIDSLTASLKAVLSADPTSGAPQYPAAQDPPRRPVPSRSAMQPAPQETDQAPDGNRVLRVNAKRINRLLGLAGQFKVSSGWLRNYAESMLVLKKKQTKLIGIIDKLRTELEGVDLSDLAKSLLNDAHNKADDCRQYLSSRLAKLENYDRRTNNLTARLNHEVISSRMRPFGDGVQGFQRMVRDIARSLGKQVNLEIAGLDTQVDREILEKMEAPLNHILCNAVDHGIEMPENRAQAGKPEYGTIRLEALHSAGMLSIVVSDDGRGVDLDRLRRKVVEQEMVSESMADNLSDSELLDFLFLPAFSTKDIITEISGRGVGLNVVHSAVQEMRGQIRATTKPGRGLRVHLQLPLTLSVIRSLLVEIAGELYAFPLARIENILKLRKQKIESLEDRQYITHENRHIGLVDATQVLDREHPTGQEQYLSIVVIGDRNSRYGVVVERLIGERDLAVHALDARLGKIKDVSAAAIAEDGTPLLILDVDDMLRTIENLVSGKRLQKVGREDTDASRPSKRILVVDDSLTVREVERKLLQAQGYHVDLAVDGMDGWNTVRIANYDLVISDIDMPRMSGIEFVSLIKADPKLKSLPVMIVSYKDRQEDRDRGLEAGADYYLTKGSFHDATLIEAVADLIGEAHS